MVQRSASMQAHEWGGTFKNMVMAAHFRRFRPGLRVAVNLFGGHYWRTQVRNHLTCTAPPPSFASKAWSKTASAFACLLPGIDFPAQCSHFGPLSPTET